MGTNTTVNVDLDAIAGRIERLAANNASLENRANELCMKVMQLERFEQQAKYSYVPSEILQAVCDAKPPNSKLTEIRCTATLLERYRKERYATQHGFLELGRPNGTVEQMFMGIPVTLGGPETRLADIVIE